MLIFTNDYPFVRSVRLAGVTLTRRTAKRTGRGRRKSLRPPPPQRGDSPTSFPGRGLCLLRYRIKILHSAFSINIALFFSRSFIPISTQRRQNEAGTTAGMRGRRSPDYDQRIITDDAGCGERNNSSSSKKGPSNVGRRTENHALIK